MLQRSFRAFVLLCLLVNGISGSPRTLSSGEKQRHSRHASCPSCRRERPDALVSWAMPPKREYRDLESESDLWRSRQSFRSNPFFYPPQYSSSPYNRASRSRGGPTIDGSRDTCKRENPFTFGRSFDFNMAPTQAAPAYNMMGPVTPHSPRMTAPMSPVRSSYGKPNFHDVTNRQSDFSPVNRYNNHGLINGAESFENTKRYAHHPPGSPQRDFRVIYRADKHLEEDYEEETPMIAQQQYPRTPFSQRRETAGVRVQQENQYVQQQKRQPENFGRIYEHRIKPYDGPADLNVYRMMQNIERDPVEVVANNTRWNHQMEEDEVHEESENLGARHIDENGDQTEAGMVEMMNNARHQNNGHFDFSEEEPREEEVKERRQMTELNKTPEEFSTQAAMETTEKVTKSSPPIMQIPRRVTVGA